MSRYVLNLTSDDERFFLTYEGEDSTGAKSSVTVDLAPKHAALITAGLQRNAPAIMDALGGLSAQARAASRGVNSTESTSAQHRREEPLTTSNYADPPVLTVLRATVHGNTYHLDKEQALLLIESPPDARSAVFAAWLVDSGIDVTSEEVQVETLVDAEEGCCVIAEGRYA